MRPEDEIRALFPDKHFGSPCSRQDLQQAELELGEPLPEFLRNLYLEFSGFRGPTDAQFFWPLRGRQGLIEMNRFFRSHEAFPREFTTKCVFFGDNGCGSQWAFKRDLPGKIIQWDPSWGTEFEIVGDDPIAAWKTEKRLFEEASETEQRPPNSA